MVFEAIRLRYQDSFGSSSNPQTENLVLDKIKFVQQNGMDDDEEMYWEKDEEPANAFVPRLEKPSLSEVSHHEIICFCAGIVCLTMLLFVL